MPGFFYFWIMHSASVRRGLPVHPHELLYQLIFGFHPMDGSPEDAVHRAQMLIQAYCLCIRTNFSIN